LIATYKEINTIWTLDIIIIANVVFRVEVKINNEILRLSEEILKLRTDQNQNLQQKKLPN